MEGEALHQLTWRLPILRGRSVTLSCAFLPLFGEVGLEQLWREVDLRLVQVGRELLQIELGIECDLELRLEVVGSKVEFDFGVLVADDRLVLVDYRVGEAGVEGLADALVACRA